jgi:hypothetical protein
MPPFNASRHQPSVLFFDNYEDPILPEISPTPSLKEDSPTLPPFFHPFGAGTTSWSRIVQIIELNDSSSLDGTDFDLTEALFFFFLSTLYVAPVDPLLITFNYYTNVLISQR